MAKRCTRCGNFLMDDERFCTRCGENVSNVMPEGAVPPVAPNTQAPQDNSFGRNDGYVSPNAQPYQQPYNNTYTQPQYQQPVYAQPVQNSDEMSVGKWVLTIIVTTFFSIVSLIFLFIWAFGDGPESRKRYCKAMLIVTAISIGLAVIVYIGLFAILAGSFGEYINKARDYYNEYGQNTVATLAALFG